MAKVVGLGIEAMYDMTSKDPMIVIELLIYLLDEKIVKESQFLEAITEMRERLPDDR